RIPIPVVQADGETAFDFTGWQANAQVRKKVSGTLVAEFDTYDATIEFDGGTMYLIRDKDDTLIDATEYEWDCKFFDPDSLTRGYIITSSFIVIGGPTE
ncbi:unnamed protein product, partial [marine sediment metagenome]